MELTGIKQAQVDDGVPLKICLSQFCKWIHKIRQQKNLTFAAGVSEPSTSELFYRRKPKGLSGALQEVGIEFSGRERSGLDDSRNTALLAWKMIRDGCLRKITRSLNKVPTQKNSSILVRNLNTNQVEEMSACNSIQGPSIYNKEPKNTINSHEKFQMKSICANFPIKAQKDQLQVKNNIKTGLHKVKSCLSIIKSKSSTSLGHLQSPTLNSPIYIQKQGKNDHLAFNTKSKSSTVGSELVLVSTTIPTVNHVSDTEMSSTLGCLPILADWEDVVLLPASQPEKNIDYTLPISDSDLEISFNSGERLMVLKESEMPSHENLGDIQETLQKSETSKSIVYKSPHTTIYNVKEAKDPGSYVSAFKLLEHKSSTCNRVNADMSHPLVLGKHPLLPGGTKRNPYSPQAFPPAKKQLFTIHEEKPTSSDCSPVRSSSRKLSPSVLPSIVNLQEPWKSGKMTPPLCKCGRGSRRLVVSNNGPNHGKVFYCCPIGKYQENRKCCGYFKWELQKERANSIVPFHSTGGLTFNSPETSHLCDRNLSISTKNSLRLRPSMRN
ncbi:ERI1 exoribonuclease 2-like [Cebus imitator]|uniref:ERI1 exoribonuclease 2-like n=1 Tax=Cebus imitator TaxID=2715852 RepID=UPI00080A3E92|nr:ERI1 exoribonuclease 2-like [Cebus imitator]